MAGSSDCIERSSTFPSLSSSRASTTPRQRPQPFPSCAASPPFPTTIFLGRDGRVRRINAGFYGPATGAQHDRLVAEYEKEIEKLLEET